MTKIKTALSLLLTAALLSALCACSNGGSGSKGSSQPETAGSSASSVPDPTVVNGTQMVTDAQGNTVPAPAPATVAPVSGDLNEMVSQMTLEEKVGQMFYIACPLEDAAGDVSEYHLGGLVLFGNDFNGKTADEVRADVESYQNAADIPLLIGVDEEGGTVVRASSNPNLCSAPFSSPREVYQSGGWVAVQNTEAEKAALLRSLGVNVNNAPVCDITGNTESFIYERSFSGNSQEVSEFVTQTVRIYGEYKLGSVLKHFPGYGDNTDTHEDLSYDQRPYESFVQSDFLPFQAGIENGADAIMVSHNIVTAMDADNPASLSSEVHRIIREELGFDGVIMTDDLAMQAITKYTPNDASAVTAVKCGNDILCCTNVWEQYPAVLAAVQSGDIPESQIDASVLRILKWKQKLGLIE